MPKGLGRGIQIVLQRLSGHSFLIRPPQRYGFSLIVNLPEGATESTEIVASSCREGHRLDIGDQFVQFETFYSYRTTDKPVLDVTRVP